MVIVSIAQMRKQRHHRLPVTRQAAGPPTPSENPSPLARSDPSGARHVANLSFAEDSLLPSCRFRSRLNGVLNNIIYL